MQFVGRIARSRIAQGSKSERDAIVLISPSGRFILRRKGGNAFSDPVLEALVDHEVEGEGAVVGQTLIANRVVSR
jgi:hypothetical protein